MNIDHDCELELDTNEVVHFLENGDEPADLGRAFESMLAIATKKGKAVCIFTVTKVLEIADADEA